jgi:hypothetical protein
MTVFIRLQITPAGSTQNPFEFLFKHPPSTLILSPSGLSLRYDASIVSIPIFHLTGKTGADMMPAPVCDSNQLCFKPING